MMCMYQKGLVSLVTPGWNGKSFVHRLLDSIIAQSYRPIEYIYVDDGSTDGTAEIVKSYAEKFREAGIGFKFIQQENKGLCEALMTGWQHVTGEYLSNPEYDDVLLSDSVKKRVEYLNSHPDCAVVVADAWVVPENNLEERINLISNKNPNRYENKHFIHCLRSNTIFNAACYMVRMNRFDETHPNRKISIYKYGANQQILLPLYYFWNRGFIDVPLSLYLEREGSVSNSKKTVNEEIERIKDYKNIRIETLKSIDMPESELKYYCNLIDTFYNKTLLHLGLKYGIWKCFYNGYKSLKRNCKTELEEESKYRFLLFKPFFFVYTKKNNKK